MIERSKVSGKLGTANLCGDIVSNKNNFRNKNYKLQVHNSICSKLIIIELFNAEK